MFNTIFFEGGILVSLFGSVETPDWTMCMYCCTFCQWDYSTKISESELEVPKLSRDNSYKVKQEKLGSSENKNMMDESD
jgi:hypothetical protein